MNKEKIIEKYNSKVKEVAWKYSIVAKNSFTEEWIHWFEDIIIMDVIWIDMRERYLIFKNKKETYTFKFNPITVGRMQTFLFVGSLPNYENKEEWESFFKKNYAYEFHVRGYGENRGTIGYNSNYFPKEIVDVVHLYLIELGEIVAESTYEVGKRIMEEEYKKSNNKK